jgi:hypothetical protein
MPVSSGLMGTDGLGIPTKELESLVLESRHSDFDKSVVLFRFGGASGRSPQSLMVTAAQFGLSVPEVAFIERRVLGRASGPPDPERVARFHEKVGLLWAASCR